MANGYYELNSSSAELQARLYYTTVENTSTNSTTITFTFRAKVNTDEAYEAPYNLKCNCVLTSEDNNGEQLGNYSKTVYANLYGGIAWNDSRANIAQYTVNITHNPDGNKSFDLSANIREIDLAQVYSTVQHRDLVRIIRKAYINSAENFTDESNPTIKYYNPMGNYIDSLQACIADENGNIIFVPYRAISKTGSSYTFNLTDAEKKTLMDAVKVNGVLTVRFYVKTTADGYNYLSSVAKTFSVDAKPLLNPTVIDIDDVTTSLTGDNSVFIRYFSDASIVINAEGQKGATIATQGANCAGKSMSGASGAIYNVESGVFTISATDSRGVTATQTIEKTLIPYTKLTCNITANINVDGTATLTVEGNYYNHTFGVEHNSLLVQWRKKADSGEWEDWEGIDYYSDDDNYKLTANFTDLDYRAEYTFEARAIDRLDTVYSQQFKFKVTPLFDWGSSDFNFNCDVNINGELYINGESIAGGEAAADEVIETGTEAMGSNGTWYWRKWSSGRAECYGKRNFGKMAVTTVWGNWYSSADFNQALPTGLFATAPEVVQINLIKANKGCIVMQGYTIDGDLQEATADNTGTFCIIRAGSVSLTESYLGFNVIGRWK